MRTKVVEVTDRFPKLFLSSHSDFVVLATKALSEVVFEGMVVHNPLAHSTYKVGYYSDKWAFDAFSSFDGAVELTND